MNQRVFHIIVSVIFVFCVMYEPDIYANPAAKDSIPVECGKEVFKGSSLDNLANELSKIVRLKRIQESIGIRVPRQKIFGNSPNTLSHEGKQFLVHLADDLSCYPETMIYIEENRSVILITCRSYQSFTCCGKMSLTLSMEWHGYTWEYTWGFMVM